MIVCSRFLSQATSISGTILPKCAHDFVLELDPGTMEKRAAWIGHRMCPWSVQQTQRRAIDAREKHRTTGTQPRHAWIFRICDAGPTAFADGLPKIRKIHRCTRVSSSFPKAGGEGCAGVHAAGGPLRTKSFDALKLLQQGSGVPTISSDEIAQKKIRPVLLGIWLRKTAQYFDKLFVHGYPMIVQIVGALRLNHQLLRQKCCNAPQILVQACEICSGVSHGVRRVYLLDIQHHQLAPQLPNHGCQCSSGCFIMSFA